MTFEKEDSSPFWSGAVVTILPMVFLLVMFYLFMRQLQAGGGKAMSFGKSRARLLSEAQNKVTFADVAGIDEAKDELEEIIAFLKDPKKFQQLGGRIPKGVLMMGPPGTGKTLLARAIAGEAGVPFFSISGSDFVEMFVGVGASRVRDLFEQGKKHAPCIIFIDEIDAVGRHRGAGLGGGHDEREQTLNQLLVEMDGFESNEGVIIIAATNRPDVLDPAILRPGRFDRRIVVNRARRPRPRGHPPASTPRRCRSAPTSTSEIIARGTPGFVGADLENLVNEAALLAARQDKDVVTMIDFEMAKDKVLMGAERRSMVISEQREAHDRVARGRPRPRRQAAREELRPGPQGDHHPARRRPSASPSSSPRRTGSACRASFAKARIAVMMGGRVAEELVFGQFTTGAGNDIKQASNLARAHGHRVRHERRDRPDLLRRGRGERLPRPRLHQPLAQLLGDGRQPDRRRGAQVHHRAATRRRASSSARTATRSTASPTRCSSARRSTAKTSTRSSPAAICRSATKVVIPTYADREKAAKEKRRAASIFGAPKPVPGT